MFEEKVEVPDEELENKDKPEEDPEKEPESDEVNYKAELEKERKLREKAESSAQYHREQAEKLRKDKPEEEDKPLTKKDLQEVEANITRKTFRAAVEAEARKLARNADEAELILHHYDNSLVPSGDVLKDVARARLLANENRVMKEKEELAAALASKEGKSKAAPSGGKPEMPRSEPSVDAETRKYLNLAGMAWDKTIGKWKNARGVTMDVNGVVADPRR